MAEIKKIEVKSIITNTGIPKSDYCINPYVGCLHGCKYCYADFMKRFTNHPGDWGDFLDVKINAPELCKKEAQRKKPGVIMLSSVTDCYNPEEEKAEVTKKCLHSLPKDKFPISILSKSSLPVRDIELFKQFKEIEVGFSFTSHRSEDRKIWEPGASDPKDKAKAMNEIHDSGIKTYLFISPILPEITDMEEIIKLNQGNFDYIIAEVLNLTPKVKAKVQAVIAKNYPDLVDLYKNNLDQYWEEKYAEYKKLIKKYGLKSSGFHHHGKTAKE